MLSNSTVFTRAYHSHSDEILFVGDPNLGKEGYQVFTQYFPNAKKVIWARNTKKTNARREIHAKRWLFTVSFYSDFVFSRDDFNFLGLPLNIHPALPSIRGVGHDYIPLLEGHEEHGSTLHFINRPLGDTLIAEKEIDSGQIIRIKKRELSSTASYSDIRRANQLIALELLGELCELMVKWTSLEQAHHELFRESLKNKLSWSQRYISRSYLQRIIEEVKSSTPYHRAFTL